MGCGASAKRSRVRALELDGAAAGLRELLLGLGVRDAARAQAALARAGVRSRPQLTLLGDKAWPDVEAALVKAKVSVGDRKRIDDARRLEMRVPLGNAQVPVVLLQAGQALQTPSSLQRIFLAVGRRAGPGAALGVSCVAFASGTETGRVPTEQLVCHNKNSSILHTGEQLRADASNAQVGLHDSERVYIWLSRVLPAQESACFVFVVALPPNNADNAGLESAYARLVNADTNQELGRMSLAALGPQGSALAIGKLYRRHAPGRSSGPWHFLALGMPLAEGEGARELQRCGRPPTSRQQQQQHGADQYADGGDHLPLAVILAADLAGPTEDGISAASRLFAFGSDVTRDMVVDPVFERGVNFASVESAVVEPVVGAGALELLPLEEASSVYSWAAGVDVGASAAVAGEAVGIAIGDAGGAIGNAGGALRDAGGALCDVQGLGDAAGVAGAGLGDAAGVVGTGVGDAAGVVGAGLGDAAGAAGAGLGDAAGAVGRAVGDAGAGGAAEAAKASAGGVMAVASGAVEVMAAGASGMVQVAGNAGGAIVGAAAGAAGPIAEFAGAAGGAALEVAGAVGGAVVGALGALAD